MFFEDECASTNAAELTRRTLIDAQERLGVMMDVMPMGLLIHTQQGALFANKEAARVLGADQADIIGRHFLDFLETSVEEAREQIDAAFAGVCDLRTSEAAVKAADGSIRTLRIIAGALPWQGTPVIQLLLQDITDLKLIQQKLETLSYTDELTGLYNRRHALSIASSWMSDASLSLVVALLDLDKFKAVNDRYGHHGGDLALQTLARTVLGYLHAENRNDVVLARVGGEEFLLLMREAGPARAIALTQGIRKAIEAAVVLAPSGTFQITASFGLAIRRADHSTFDELLSEADVALYQAKATGRNKVCISEMSLSDDMALG